MIGKTDKGAYEDMSSASLGHCLVIDTSYGSCVGIIGCSPIVEADSRCHVEKLQVNIDRAISDAGLGYGDLDTVIVGTGPAPFTGLRAGIVAARALAFAEDIRIIGQDILEPQALWRSWARKGDPGNHDNDDSGTYHLTLAVNDARRKQLYYALYGEARPGSGYARPADSRDALPDIFIPMDIASAEDIADSVLSYLSSHSAEICAQAGRSRIAVDIVGNGSKKYRFAWDIFGDSLGQVVEGTCLSDRSPEGLGIFARTAWAHCRAGDACGTEPLYLRRPDITIPSAGKHRLGQTSISLSLGSGTEGPALS